MIMIRSSRSFLGSAASVRVPPPHTSTMGRSLATHAGEHHSHDQCEEEDDAGDDDEDDGPFSCPLWEGVLLLSTHTGAKFLLS